MSETMLLFVRSFVQSFVFHFASLTQRSNWESWYYWNLIEHVYIAEGRILAKHALAKIRRIIWISRITEHRLQHIAPDFVMISFCRHFYILLSTTENCFQSRVSPLFRTQNFDSPKLKYHTVRQTNARRRWMAPFVACGQHLFKMACQMYFIVLTKSKCNYF